MESQITEARTIKDFDPKEFRVSTYRQNAGGAIKLMIEHITSGITDDKTSKRQYRLTFLKLCAKAWLVKKFFSAFCNIINGKNGFTQYDSQHIVFTATGGNLVTVFANLIINILDFYNKHNGVSSLYYYNTIILSALMKNDKINPKDIAKYINFYISKIATYFNKLILKNAELADILQFFRLSTGSDFDYTLSINISPPERNISPPERNISPISPISTKKQKTQHQQPQVGGNGEPIDFFLGRIKSSHRCDDGIDPPTDKDKESAANYEAALKVSCFRVFNKFKAKFESEAPELNIDKLNNLYPSQMQSKYTNIIE